jgi:hypothetical protein
MDNRRVHCRDLVLVAGTYDSLRLVTRARSIHVHRLRRPQSRRDRRAVARISQTRKQLFFVRADCVRCDRSDFVGLGAAVSLALGQKSNLRSGAGLLCRSDRVLGRGVGYCDIGVGDHFPFHGRGDVSPPLPRARGISRGSFVDLGLPGRSHTLLLVLDFDHDRNRHRVVHCNFGDLLHRAPALYRDRDFVAVVCLPARVWITLHPAIRTGLRCLGRHYRNAAAAAAAELIT